MDLKKRGAHGLAAAVIVVFASAPGVAQRFDAAKARMKNIEMKYYAAALVDVIAAQERDVVASFGVHEPRVLQAVAERIGAAGRLYSIHRAESVYRGIADLVRDPYRQSVRPIFADDGDAHLERGSAAVMILMDTEGFFRRENDLYRQAREGLAPGGRLIILRQFDEDPGESRGPGRGPAAGPRAPRSKRLAEGQRLRLETYGFELVGNPDLLQVRTVWIFERKG